MSRMDNRILRGYSPENCLGELGQTACELVWEVKLPKALYANFMFWDCILYFGKPDPGTEPKVRVGWSSGCSVASDIEAHLALNPVTACAPQGSPVEKFKRLWSKLITFRIAWLEMFRPNEFSFSDLHLTLQKIPF